MFITEGLWINLTVGGVSCVLSQLCGGKTLFIIFVGSEQKTGDVYSRYYRTLRDGFPKEDDQSNFALLYREVESLVRSKKLEGPYGEDHPRVFMRFNYVSEFSQVELLNLLEEAGFSVKIQNIPHKGDDSEYEQAKQDFARWIDSETNLQSNPKVEEKRQKKINDELREKRGKKADIIDKRLQRFVYIPLFFLIIFGVFSWNRVAGSLFLSFSIFSWFWLRRD